MPSTRLERILAAAGVAATLALAALTAVAWAEYGDTESPTGTVTVPTSSPVGTTATATERAETRSVETRTTDTRASETKPESASANVANLVLTAARGDCWLQVRAGSAGGELLYIGILEQAETRRFSGDRLWLELGAPSNLDATVNGKPLEFSDEPTTALVTPEGLA